MSSSRITKHAVDSQRSESKTQATSIVAIAYVVNVHFIHQSECSNRLMMPFPRIFKHTVYSYSVYNMITTNKYRGFSAVESSRTIGSWCLWMNLTVKARHRQQLLLPLHSKCALYTPKWLMMPFPRISMHAVYTKSDKDVITTRHRQQVLLPLHSKCAHCTLQWIFQQSADAISQNIQACIILIWVEIHCGV